MTLGVLYIGLPLSSVIAAPFLRHAFDMYKENKFQTLVGSIFWASFPFGVSALTWASSGEAPVKSAVIFSGLIFAFIGGSAGAWAAYRLSDISGHNEDTEFKMVDPKQPGTPYAQNVTSYNQSGGITAGNINIGRPARDLDKSPDLKNQILAELPRDKPITVMALLGDQESANLAMQIYDFLKQNNFKLTEGGISRGVFTSKTEGLIVQDQGTSRQFIVGTP